MRKFFASFCMVAALAVMGCGGAEQPGATGTGTGTTDGEAVVVEEEVTEETPEATTPETTPPADGATE